ncbi:hypothetical protein [Mycobacteroides chelonae]|uniref:hypothetical protein n=1 Tax=Mycobacteroides chelonae TaxID=1774 RepID=UPI0009C47678|nr:hypothetical protein [Mycobacteroides chelonae]MBF9523307.1 hypothetical protein [Mycobacteroides chelonae]SKL93075.1 Uncharacterised protein [Mycobacteroides abscessus subsp. bolletii]
MAVWPPQRLQSVLQQIPRKTLLCGHRQKYPVAAKIVHTRTDYTEHSILTAFLVAHRQKCAEAARETALTNDESVREDDIFMRTAQPRPMASPLPK